MKKISPIVKQDIDLILSELDKVLDRQEDVKLNLKLTIDDTTWTRKKVVGLGFKGFCRGLVIKFL